LPLPKEQVKAGVLYLTDPFHENVGWSYSHKAGIGEMKNRLGLEDEQILHESNVDEMDPGAVENAIRKLIANGANIIIATSFGYMDVCEKLAEEFPNHIFANANGNKYNKVNFTNYFGRFYQARYLAGILAGMKTQSGKIGFVAAMGKDSSEVTCGVNAFALGVEKANPRAKVYVRVTHSWFDPMGETGAARALIAAGCDIITQHCDTPWPQIEAERAGVWSIGDNSDMAAEAPRAVLSSMVWNWGIYYTALVQSVMDGSFETTPWYGSLGDGIVDLLPLSDNFVWDEKIPRALLEERQRIASGANDVFDGILITNEGAGIGKANGSLSDEEIRNGMDWYYRNIVEF
jgi:basic membrane protein A